MIKKELVNWKPNSLTSVNVKKMPVVIQEIICNYLEKKKSETNCSQY